MPAAHCPQCATYEERVMAKAPQASLPADVVPCAHFVMSDAFRDWAVAEMRKEVLGQVSMSGLDRMALLKSKAPEAKGASGQGGAAAQNHQSKSK